MSRLFDMCIKTHVSGCLHKSFNNHGLIVHELLHILPQHVSQLLHVLQNARKSGIEKIELKIKSVYSIHKDHKDQANNTNCVGTS